MIRGSNMMWMEARLNLSTIMMAKLLQVSMSSTRRLGRMDRRWQMTRQDLCWCCDCCGTGETHRVI